MNAKSTKFYLCGEPQRTACLSFISALTLEGKGWDLRIEKHVEKRSLDQNALAHKWVSEICDFTGDDHEYAWEQIKRKFLRPITGSMGGESYSTKKLSTEEFSTFLDQINALASSFYGIRLTDPQDLRDQSRRW